MISPVLLLPVRAIKLGAENIRLCFVKCASEMLKALGTELIECMLVLRVSRKSRILLRLHIRALKNCLLVDFFVSSKGYALADSAAICPAKDETKVLRLVRSDSSEYSPVAEAVRGEVRTVAAP